MPFTTSNVKTFNLGGGLFLTEGTWTGAVGDATGTITIRGASIRMGRVQNNSAGAWIECPYSWAAGSTANTVTVTVENIATVSSGTFAFITR